MKIIIAPDSFKGSLTAREAANAIEEGILRVIPDAQCVTVPMADGGEGTVRSLVDATHGDFAVARVTNPLGQKVDAVYGILGDGETAVIEMAAASGIQFVDDETKNPLITTTYGTGELILDALDHGVKHIIVGLGGSATNDAGAGMAQALGVHLVDSFGTDLPFGGAALANLASIDTSQIDPRLADVDITLASDVTNPLVGEQGASAVFGPQKGATPSMVLTLDAALTHFTEVVKVSCDRDIAQLPGAGAAGGLGAGFLAFTHAQMKPGVSIVTQATGLEEKAKGCDYCFTGEGGIDSQTRFGKTPMGVVQAVKSASPDCKTIALAGQVSRDVQQLYSVGFDAIFGILPRTMSVKDAISQAYENVANTAENVARIISWNESVK
ncbi:glycerate kinase [Alloscardovia venturai]|uniref:Glycerate kinase n=1 Tax=Alloscardovia venturai TaxID=1769421 RepID=A0ABW2Y5K0_9BIFI